MKIQKQFPVILMPVLILTGMLFLFGCSEQTPVDPALTGTGGASDGDPFILAEKSGVDIEFQDGSITPSELVTVDCFGRPLTLWPFTGAKLDGVPMDPVNLIFTGNADPVQIRAALLALDGDRSILGLPDAYPFNQVWKDAMGGGVQSTYADEGRWVGSVIQLTLGDYQPVRFHLRLFRTAARMDDGSPITIGAAHFEVLIPGTTDHQVLSWNAAKEMVVGDMMRTGLLDPAEHLMPSGPITPAPTFRYIIPAVYNGLPDYLRDDLFPDGPVPPVDDPVGIPNDGQAMIVHLAGPATVTSGEFHDMTTVEFGQYVPRPYCSSGPYDYLWIEGAVDFHNSSMVDEFGQFSYQGGYAGVLTAVPVDISTGQPIGPPFTADVTGNQEGFMNFINAQVKAYDQKLTHEADGPQMDFIRLHVGENGTDMYRAFNKCLDGE